MHPLLDKDRFATCEALIDALEECHRSPVLGQLFGKCSEDKARLTACLHEARLAHDREQVLLRREKNAAFALKKQQMHEEEWGPDGYLQRVVELELAAKQQQQAQRK